MISVIENEDWGLGVNEGPTPEIKAGLTDLAERWSADAPVSLVGLSLGGISDERRHFGFGENSLGRRLADDPALRPHLNRIRNRLDPIVLDVFAGALSDIQAPPEARARLGRDYLATIERLGLT